jgi:tannase
MMGYGGIYKQAIIGKAPAHQFFNCTSNPSCELDRILNATISACDSLHGRTDEVVSRSDLCKLHFNLSSIVGLPYSCAAETKASLGLGFGNKR